MIDWRLTIFGLMTLFVVYYLQDGIVGFFRQSLFGRSPRARCHAGGGRRAMPMPFAGTNVAKGVAGGELLKVDQVLMQFGGLKALNQRRFEQWRVQAPCTASSAPTVRAKAR